MRTWEFCCPVCKGQLIQKDNSLLCPAGHSFDIARQGYVNLVPPQQKHSKLPGDTAEMVLARRRILQAGHYNLFRDKLCLLVWELIQGSPVILDCGCGEGYYTGAMQSAHGNASIWGFDISKAAVKAAAGSYKQPGFAVASVFSIPFRDNSAQLITNIFAPVEEKELNRVLQPGGAMLMAVPGERHLWQMKEVLYSSPYENQLRDIEYSGFKLESRVPVKGEIQLEAGEIYDLFAMTPYYWRTDLQGVERLKGLKSLKTEIHFDFLIYRKTGSSAP